MSFLPTGKPYARLADFPLDPSCVYGSDAEASSYARTSPVAYAGQVISVTNPPGVYMIRSDRSLLPLFGGTVDSVAVPAEPKEVPVKVEMTAHTRKPVTKRKRGSISLMP